MVGERFVIQGWGCEFPSMYPPPSLKQVCILTMHQVREKINGACEHVTTFRIRFLHRRQPDAFYEIRLSLSPQFAIRASHQS